MGSKKQRDRVTYFVSDPMEHKPQKKIVKYYENFWILRIRLFNFILITYKTNQKFIPHLHRIWQRLIDRLI